MDRKTACAQREHEGQTLSGEVLLRGKPLSHTCGHKATEDDRAKKQQQKANNLLVNLLVKQNYRNKSWHLPNIILVIHTFKLTSLRNTNLLTIKFLVLLSCTVTSSERVRKS